MTAGSHDENLQSSGLKQIIVLFLDSRIVCVWWQGEPPTLVNLGQDLCTIIVESAVKDKHDVHTRRLSDKALLAESVWFEHAILHGSDFELVLEVRAVQRSKI